MINSILLGQLEYFRVHKTTKTMKRLKIYEPCSWLLTFVIVVIKIGTVNGVTIPNMNMDCYIQEGNLNIGFMKQIHKMETDTFCGDNLESEYELQYVEAFRWAIDQVNARTDLLPNITLGFAVLDDCGRDLTALAKSLYLIPSSDQSENR